MLGEIKKVGVLRKALHAFGRSLRKVDDGGARSKGGIAGLETDEVSGHPRGKRGGVGAEDDPRPQVRGHEREKVGEEAERANAVGVRGGSRAEGDAAASVAHGADQARGEPGREHGSARFAEECVPRKGTAVGAIAGTRERGAGARRKPAGFPAPRRRKLLRRAVEENVPAGTSRGEKHQWRAMRFVRFV